MWYNWVGDEMNYIIIDLEWNQATYKTMRLRRDLNLRGEIIQIGAVKINEQYEILGTFNKFIKPIVFSKMNPFVANLLMLNDDDLAYCDNFLTIYREFLNWCGDSHIFLSWGNDDSVILMDNLKVHSFEKGLTEFYDLQKMYGRISGVSKGFHVSLDNALENIGVNNQLMRHDALGDAMNTMIIARNAGLLAQVDEITMKKNHTKEIVQLANTLATPDFVQSSVSTSLNAKKLFEHAENALVCPVCLSPVAHDPCKKHAFRSLFTHFECGHHGEFFAQLTIESFKDVNYVSTKYYFESDELRNYYKNPVKLPDFAKNYFVNHQKQVDFLDLDTAETK